MSAPVGRPQRHALREAARSLVLLLALAWGAWGAITHDTYRLAVGCFLLLCLIVSRP